MASSSPVTLKQLAEHLGLGRSTVSEALSGRGRISAETRERVRRAAEELGYRPDPVMSAFSRRGRSSSTPPPGHTLAAITRQFSPHSNFLRDMSQFTEKLGYNLSVFALNDYPSQHALIRVLEARGIVGVIFIEDSPPIELETERWQRLRCVYCGPYPGTGDVVCPVDLVRHNPFDSMTLAWRKAIAVGAQRIGLILPLQPEAPSVLEEKSLAAYYYRQRVQNPRAAVLEPLVLPFDRLNEEPAHIREWVAAQRPDLIIAGFQALHAAILRCGYQIPQDFSLISLRVQPKEQAVAGCMVKKIHIAEVALQHLHGLIQHSEKAAAQHSTTLVVNPIWYAAETCPG